MRNSTKLGVCFAVAWVLAVYLPFDVRAGAAMFGLMVACFAVTAAVNSKARRRKAPAGWDRIEAGADQRAA